MNNQKFCKFLICVVLATIFALTTHIYLLKWISPILESMSQGVDMNPNPSNYSSIIIFFAYGTAFLANGFLAYVYYHTQHLIPGKSKPIRILFLTLIIFALKGEPIRQPIMNVILNYEIGLNNPFLFVLLQQMDKWLALFLLAACLIYLCPNNNKPKSY